MARHQQGSDEREARFCEYLDRLCAVSGHRDRHAPLRAYLTGLCLEGKRKSIEPMAARIDPRRVSILHQAMHHFVAKAPWDDRALLTVARGEVLARMGRHGGVQAWAIDDTGIPKKGSHSVGVARQYCGNLGKEDNCQVAVSVSLVNEMVSVPAAYGLYLPNSWAEEEHRRAKVEVPQEVRFQKKWEIAMGQIEQLREEGVPQAPVVADAGYGNATEFRERLTAMAIPYVVGIQMTTTVWPAGSGPIEAAPYRGRGRPPKLLRRTPRRRPLEVGTLALGLPPSAWRRQSWGEGTKGTLRSRFAALRVRPAHRDYRRHEPRPQEWLLIEWPSGDKAPTKYWLSTLPADTTMGELVMLAKVRWRIEVDYQELKDEFGLDHFEGRGWRGFHHHATLCIAAYAFAAAERARFSPSAALSFLRTAALPRGFRPRGAASTR